MKNCRISFVGMTLSALLSACAVGPDYVKPSTVMPVKYKEAPKNWKVAEPQDEQDRGPWWDTFHDRELNKLEDSLNISNQTIAAAAAQYFQARALVDEARAAYFPTLGGSVSITRQKFGTSVGQGNANSIVSGSTVAAGGFSGGGGNGNPSNSHTSALNAAWEPDIWGNVRRTVEANAAAAEASAASLASVRLSSQAMLAQTYFELRALDNDQKILNDTVVEYKKILTYTQNRYALGVAAEADILQAKTQWETAAAAAVNNGILRGQYEHAIAVLLGMPPANFTIVAVPCAQRPPAIPLEIPSKLLERRPDVAEAERLMAQANAQIGIAVSAYYPVLNLTGTGSVTNPGFAHWFSLPALSWAIGAELSDTLFDGGLRNATVVAARANFDATVGNYRQTVLAALQNVEDNLVALRLLNQEAKIEDRAAIDSNHALQLVLNEYRAGTVDFGNVLTAASTALAADKTAADVRGLQMTAAVGLIKALGGGWDVSALANAAG